MTASVAQKAKTATVFIDGEAGTTGLEIRERLAGIDAITVKSIDPDKRKDKAARADMMRGVDLAQPRCAYQCCIAACARQQHATFLEGFTDGRHTQRGAVRIHAGLRRKHGSIGSNIVIFRIHTSAGKHQRAAGKIVALMTHDHEYFHAVAAVVTIA